MTTELDQCCEERDALLHALDVDGMIALLQRQHVGVSTADRRSILRGMHQARVMLRSMTEAERAISRQWLREHGERIPPGALPAVN